MSSLKGAHTLHHHVKVGIPAIQKFGENFLPAYKAYYMAQKIMYTVYCITLHASFN